MVNVGHRPINGLILGAAVIALAIGACSGAGTGASQAAATGSRPGATAAQQTPAGGNPVGTSAISSVGLPSLAAGPVGPVAIKAGPDLCALLSAADFAAAGVQGAGPVSKNALLAPTNFFCVYAGMSGATGGIELDASIIDPKDGDQVTATVSPFGSEDVTKQVPGADKAIVYLPAPPSTEPAAMGVQAGTVLLGLTIPETDSAKAALIGLSSLAVARLAAATAGTLTLPPQLLLPEDLCDWVTPADLATISTSPLAAAKPEVSGEFGFNDRSVGGSYLGKQVTCLYRDANNNNGLRMDVLHEPSDLALIQKVYGEQVAYYANEVANSGELTSVVTPLSGIGEAAQKVKQSYTAGGAFNDWILEAVKGPVIVRLAADDSGGAQEKSEGALVTLLGRILDKAVSAVGG